MEGAAAGSARFAVGRDVVGLTSRYGASGGDFAGRGGTVLEGLAFASWFGASRRGRLASVLERGTSVTRSSRWCWFWILSFLDGRRFWCRLLVLAG